MNFSKRRGESRPSGRLRPRRSVGTRGGCGDGWGPCACPGEWRFRQGCMLTHWILSPGRGQAQGPLIHPTPPLVPTGRLTSLAAFGRQHSSGFDGLFVRLIPIGRPKGPLPTSTPLPPLLFFDPFHFNFYFVALKRISSRSVRGGVPLERNLLAFNRHIGMQHVPAILAGHV